MLAFDSVVETDELERNPVSVVKMPRPKVKEIDPPSEAQVADMLELAREGGTWWYPAMRLSAYTGMRRGEVMGLRWENVNLAGEYLDVRESLGYVRGRLVVETPKTDSSRRRVDLDSETVQILSDHKSAQEAHILGMGAEYDDQGIVFTKPDGGYFFPGSYSEAIRALSRRTGPKLRAHDLRHFHASVWLSSGAPLLPLSKRLGHASVKMTLDSYAHAMPGAQREGLDVFVAALNGGKNGGSPRLR